MIEQVTTIISTIGFPIAMCVMMVYYYHNSVEQLKATVGALNTTINELNNKIDALIGGRRADDKGD